MNQQQLLKWKSLPRYNTIRYSIKMGHILDFIVGTTFFKHGGYSTSEADDIPDAGVVLSYLDAFLTENDITNEIVNNAFQNITINNILNARLVVFYIEYHLKYKSNQSDYYIDLDVCMLANKLKECKLEYKEDNIVKWAVERIKEKYGYNIEL